MNPDGRALGLISYFSLPYHLGGLGRPRSRRQALAALFMASSAFFMAVSVLLMHAINLGAVPGFVKDVWNA